MEILRSRSSRKRAVNARCRDPRAASAGELHFASRPPRLTTVEHHALGSAVFTFSDGVSSTVIQKGQLHGLRVNSHDASGKAQEAVLHLSHFVLDAPSYFSCLA